MKNKVLQTLQEIRPEMDFTQSDSFIDDGYLDSFDLVLLVSNLDKSFGISILGEDILPENFKNLDSIFHIVQKYQK